MKKYIILITLLTFSNLVKSQKITICDLKFRIVSLDPIAKRVFVSYDYLFESEVPKNADSVLISIFSVLNDSLTSYCKSLFKLKSVSFFRLHQYARYGPPKQKQEREDWSKQYIAEYLIDTNQIILNPASQRKKSIIKL